MRFLCMVAGAAAIAASTAGAATTFVFEMDDTELGNKYGTEAGEGFYGLRLDVQDKYFSFAGAGPLLTVTEDGASDSASMTGTVVENEQGVAVGNPNWLLSYNWTGVTANAATGEFTATGGSGTLFNAATNTELLLSFGRRDGLSAVFQIAGPGDDLAKDFATGTYALESWVFPKQVRGANDFLAVATPVPLPAPAFMLLAGLGGLAAIKRRRKSA